jgi:hypothetical protein
MKSKSRAGISSSPESAESGIEETEAAAISAIPPIRLGLCRVSAADNNRHNQRDGQVSNLSEHISAAPFLLRHIAKSVTAYET